MKKFLLILLTLALICGTFASCQPVSVDPTPDDPEPPEDKDPIVLDYAFDGSISREVLANYLAHAVTISYERSDALHAPRLTEFVRTTGAKYICRSMTIWNPGAAEEADYPKQKDMIDAVHAIDPDVILEACIFECVGQGVNAIPIPAFVFEAFGLTPEERNFSYDKMIFEDGLYRDQWGAGISVPDMTRLETQMFFYYRAARYIDTGYEGLHLGQVHLIGAHDTDWTSWTKVLNMIRAYAATHARRHVVLLNAHTHGIVDADGKMMFDFHMFPSRPMPDWTQAAHKPTEDDPQRVYFKEGYYGSIYGDSLGGMTHSGWECESLLYLVELDNYGQNVAALNTPVIGNGFVWGMDEITWFANQPTSYRHAFLDYANKWVTSHEPGISIFAMPCERVATIYNPDGSVKDWTYRGYTGGNFNDEETIRDIWAAYDENYLAGNPPVAPDSDEPAEQEPLPAGNVLALSVDLNMSSSDTLAYLFMNLCNPDYTIAEGDCLEYDVFLSDDVAGFGGVDANFSDGGTLRDAGVFDSLANNVHPQSDLSVVAYGKWYHRVVFLGNGAAGKTIATLQLAAHPVRGNNANPDNKNYMVYYDNIMITNGEDTKEVIFDDDYDAADAVIQMRKATDGRLLVLPVDYVG